MPDSPVFDRTCEELERRTSLDRLEARGTVRLALKAAGLDVGSVDKDQMRAVLRKLLPRELATRGVDAAGDVCEQVVGVIERLDFRVAADRAGAAAETMRRLGG